MAPKVQKSKEAKAMAAANSRQGRMKAHQGIFVVL
jgi:hypothetical protein